MGNTKPSSAICGRALDDCYVASINLKAPQFTVNTTSHVASDNVG
jgi:hypothetical protein